LGILALLGLTTAAARPPAPDSLEAIRDSATEAPSPTAPAEDRPVAAPEDVRAVLVGDSIALSLYSAYQPGLIEGLTVLPGTEFGCGLVPYRAAVAGAPMPPIRPECVNWEQERAGRIGASGASLGVLFAGPWEMYDRLIDGRAVPFTDPKWREATVNSYARVLAELTAATPKQAVVLNSCHGAPSLDLPDAAGYQAGRLPDIVNDPRRIDAVNQAVKEAVRRSGRDIPVLDPNPFLCDGEAYRAQIDGVTMHTDGVHFTEEGARLYWEWLGPRLLKAGRTEQATPASPGP
jgi:SGNH domain (fused to AT3 domains)